MASRLWVAEYLACARDANGTPIAAPQGAPLIVNVVDFSGGEAKSPTLLDNTAFVMVWADTQCAYRLTETGATAVAVATGSPLGAGGERFFGVNPRTGTAAKISVIANP